MEVPRSMRIPEIAELDKLEPKKLKIQTGFNPKQVKVGTKVEKQHGVSDKEAKKIAADHLREYQDYYKRIAKVLPDVKKERNIIIGD